MRNLLNPISVRHGQLEERRLGRPKIGLGVLTILISTALAGSSWFVVLPLSGDKAGLRLAGVRGAGLRRAGVGRAGLRGAGLKRAGLAGFCFE